VFEKPEGISSPPRIRNMDADAKMSVSASN